MKSKIIVNIRKLISVLICTMLISSTLPPNLLNYTVFASNQTEVSNFDSLKNAVDNANDGDVIILTSNIAIPNSSTATEENYRCLLNCSKNITIKSASGQTHTINHRSPDGILALINGCTVNFENIIIDFGKTTNNFDVENTLIKIFDGSTLNIKSETKLQNAYVKSGSAIFCTDNSKINIDQTSSIINLSTPYNGIMYLNNGSELTLNGFCSDCRALNGGAIYLDNSIATINGTISNCGANDCGGAMYLNGGTAVINGNISNCGANNCAGAIYAVGSVATINGNISNCHTINYTTNNCAGAIYLNGSTATINGNISNCSAKYGGAIYSEYTSTLRIGSGSISGCSVESYEGQGQGNAIYNGLGSKLYLPSPDSGLVSIVVADNALGEDNAEQKYGYKGIYDDDITTPATLLYRVQFDLNGGVDSKGNASIAPVDVTSGDTLGNMLPTNIIKTLSGVDLQLSKWVDSNKNEVTSMTPINKNITLYAKYGAPHIKEPVLTKEQSGATYTAGSWSNEHITISYSVLSPDAPINPQKYKISLNGTEFNDISNYSSSDTLRIDLADESNLIFTIIKGGEYQIKMQAFDSEGLSTMSNSIPIKIDKDTPDPVRIDSADYSNVATVEMYGIGETGCTVTATDENGNIIGTSIVDSNGEWAITTSQMQDGEHTIYIVQTDKAGNTSDSVSKDIIIDTIAPTGSINIGSNNFYQFLNTITFGLLFTETTNVTISASDDSSLSGLNTIEYLKTDQVYSKATDIPTTADWQTDTISNNSISFDINIPQQELNDKFFIYARITDNAGNTTYIRSDGVIIYTDSNVTTDEISYTKLDSQDKDISVNLNGNTISSITNGNNTLSKNIDYRIENNKIILKHEYLNSLDAGDYELTISFSPAGETHLDPSLTLPSYNIPLYVEKASQSYPPEDEKFNNLKSAYTYGDDPGVISLNGGSGTGALTYVSKNPEVATIDPTTGKLTILKAGTFEIIATKAADDNYEEMVVTSNEITVNKREVTITGITANPKTYDGNKNASFSIANAKIQNLINNDQVTIQPGIATFTDKNVDNKKTVSFSNFGLTGADANNYNLSSQPDSVTASISTKPVTITGITAKDKEYDGTPDATPNISATSIDGAIAEDNLSFVIGFATFSNKHAGNGKTVAFSNFALTGTDAKNYRLTAQPANATANIYPKQVIITGVSADNKTYDGTTTAIPIISAASIKDKIAGDNVSFSTGSAAFSDKHVGNSKTVYFSNFKLTGTDANNYLLASQPANDTANIYPKQVIITGVTAQNKVYDGTTNAIPITSNASITNKINGDDLSFIPGSTSFSDKNVENKKIVTFADFVLSGQDAHNYNLYNQPAYTTANITPKPLTISNIVIRDKVFDNTITAEYDKTPTLNGLINGDNVTLINGIPVFTSASVGTNIPIIFSTPFSLEGNDAYNYSITQPSDIYGNIVAYDPGDGSNTDNNYNDTTSNSENNTNSTNPSSEGNALLEFPELDDDDSLLEFPELAEDTISGTFGYENFETGIQVSAPEGVIPPWCTLVVEEIYPNTDLYNKTFEQLDDQKKVVAEHHKLYAIHLEDQNGNVFQPDISKGLMTVKIPVPDNYDLNDLEIYRINEDTDDEFDENVVTVNNKNYCEFQTDHFSPYIIIDKNTTRDILPYIIISLILLFIALFIIVILKRKRDQEKQQ